MIQFQEKIRDLVDEKLNDNDYGIVFDVSLYNSTRKEYEKTVNNTDDYGTTTSRFVPVNISNISGEYLNIPNVSVLTSAISLDFDLFLGSYTDLPYQEQNKFLPVDYESTLSAIEDFRHSILAKPFSLGTKLLYFGGEDSYASVTSTASDFNTIYIKFTPLGVDTEKIFESTNLTINKTGTGISITCSGGTSGQIDYTVGEEKEFIVYEISGTCSIYDGTTKQSVTSASQSVSTFTLGNSTNGLEAKLERFTVSSTYITESSKDNILNDIDTYLSGIFIDYYDFENRRILTNNISSSWSGTINNCITFGSEGVIAFSVDALVPVGDVVWDGNYAYQEFGMDLGGIISQDVILGNYFDYFLRDKTAGDSSVQVYPVDRQHSYNMEIETAQYINGTYGVSVGKENMKDITQTFYYIPSKTANKLLKQITINTITQNREFELVVYFPFFTVSYDVIVENGGTSPNINDLATFTLTFKQIDSNL